MSFEKKLSISLFLLRAGVFIVMFMWTIDKFINPNHAALVFKKFYLLPGLSENLVLIIGGLQMIIILSFLLGLFKKWSYLLVLLLHAVSTFSSWKIYLDPWGPKNLLFFAAWPMLAACLALYLLKERDNFLTLKTFKS